MLKWNKYRLDNHSYLGCLYCNKHLFDLVWYDLHFWEADGPCISGNLQDPLRYLISQICKQFQYYIRMKSILSTLFSKLFHKVTRFFSLEDCETEGMERHERTAGVVRKAPFRNKVKKWRDIFMALFVRLLFFISNLLCCFRAADLFSDHKFAMIGVAIISFILLSIESIYIVYRRKGKEPSWWVVTLLLFKHMKHYDIYST